MVIRPAARIEERRSKEGSCLDIDCGCEYLPWDSEFFGYPIARVTVPHLRPERIDPLLAWCAAHAVRCLYCLAAADDPEAIRVAEDHGFRLVDVRMTYERRLDQASGRAPRPLSGLVRPVAAQDIPALRAIARGSYRDSRFYYDGHFAAPRVDALYETWIEQSCRGGADLVLVAEQRGQPVGFVTCHRQAPAGGSLDLLGVAAVAQGQGLGRELFEAGCRWFADQDITRVTTVTQGRNIRAQRLFQQCGFLTHSVQLWYHRWFS